jgi:hypothetical protein
MIQRWEITQEVFGHIECRVYRDNFQVYRFEATDFPSLMMRMAAVTMKLATLPIKLHNRKDINEHIVGREIFYREFPAIITDFDGENGRVRVRSDYPPSQSDPARYGFPPEPWDDPKGENSQDVWEDLLSPRIHWHRSEAA